MGSFCQPSFLCEKIDELLPVLRSHGKFSHLLNPLHPVSLKVTGSSPPHSTSCYVVNLTTFTFYLVNGAVRLCLLGEAILGG